jgi:very-short-patch-repair endonuclease
MYLVRSVELEHLSPEDRLRRNLIAHFATPFAQDEMRVEDLRKSCESPFEREMYDELTQRGYWVTPQVRVGQYRIDMVAEGHNDARLAVECDGDKYHGADKWADDMQRQRVLERAGWVFWRCFASAFIRRRKDMLDDLSKTLAARGIEPIGAEGAPRSVHTEHRIVSSLPEPELGQGAMEPVDIGETERASISEAPSALASSARGDAHPAEVRPHPLTDNGGLFDRGRVRIPSVKSRDANLPFSDYTEYAGPAGNDPRSVTADEVSEGIVSIIEVEGPVLAKRVYDIYLRSCGIKRMGHELKSTMNKALSRAIQQGRVICEDEAGKGGFLFSIVRAKGSPAIRLRSRGPRSFEEIPLSELQVVARYLLERDSFLAGSEEHLRAVLECFDLKRLTQHVGTTFREALERSLPYVDEYLASMHR